MSLLPVVPAAVGDFSLIVAGGTSLVLSDLLSAWDGESDVVLNVTANVGATSISVPAIDFDTPGTFRLVVPSGVRVSGAGGKGGDQRGLPGDDPVGGDGGDALNVASGVTLTIKNEGTIAGGGGGGAASNTDSLPGGGGGAGNPVGVGGLGGAAGDGADGTATTGGAGAEPSGGDGGDLGQPGGSAGANAGGAAGHWIVNAGTVIQTGGGSYLGTTSGL